MLWLWSVFLQFVSSTFFFFDLKKKNHLSRIIMLKYAKNHTFCMTHLLSCLVGCSTVVRGCSAVFFKTWFLAFMGNLRKEGSLFACCYRFFGMIMALCVLIPNVRAWWQRFPNAYLSFLRYRQWVWWNCFLRICSSLHFVRLSCQSHMWIMTLISSSFLLERT